MNEMKNVQVIDGALNRAYLIYQFTEEQYEIVFPLDDQDIEFIEDLELRLREDQLNAAFEGVWDREIDKKHVCGIHGTLFYELAKKKEFYPLKQEKALIGRPPKRR